MMASFLLGAISATAVALSLGIRVQPKLITDRLAQTEIAQEADPVALSRLKRSDRLVTAMSNAPTKMPLQPAVAAATAEAPAMAAEPVAAEESELAEIPDVGEDLLPEENYVDSASVSGAEAPNVEGKRVLPSLYFDREKKQRIIGNFQTRSFPGDRETCREIGESMAKDPSGSSSALQTLADSSAIKVLRICAANGSVIISCRSGQVTISPRQVRPDDKCDEYRTRQVAGAEN
jgi:hypothetical protein